VKTKSGAPQLVIEKLYILMKAGYEAFLVGGCVRDVHLGRSPKDWDIATNALPEQIQTLFPESFYDNNFGTVSVKSESEDPTLKIIQITPYRSEGKYADGRRPDTVSFGVSLEEDLKRRDFTINAIAWNPIKDILSDPHHGLEDIRAKTIRAVGDANERFSEDGLRILRAIRFAAELDFDIEQDTMQAIKAQKDLLKVISAERIRDEFSKLILSDRPEYGLSLMLRSETLEFTIPELLEAVGVEQTQAHAFDVWTHLIKTVQHSADKKLSLEVRLAALFHDIGKPATRRRDEVKNTWTFYGHEVIGAKMTKKILTRLKYPQNIIDEAVKLVRWHMFFSDTEQITLSAVRRMVANVGKDRIWDLIDVRMCDRIGTGRPKEDPYRLRKYKAMIDEALRDPVTVGMLAVDGTTLMQELGVAPGPQIGFVLNALMEEVLEDPKLNTKEILLEKSRALLSLSDAELREKGLAGKRRREQEEAEAVAEIKEKHHVE
jgi:tRNA nucleotidyltransferase (CCA-adding enzyme)